MKLLNLFHSWKKPVNCKLLAVNVGSFPTTKQTIPKGDGNYLLWYWGGDVRLDKLKKRHAPSFALLVFCLFDIYWSLFLCWCKKYAKENSWVAISSRDLVEQP